METIDVIKALEEAIGIINRKREALAGGSQTIWRVCFHASDYLEKQIAALLAPEVK
jgi:hypothetical protein